MLGIIIAVVIAAWTVLVGGHAMETGFLSAMGFLWAWYWIWTIVFGILVVGIMLAATGVMTFIASDAMTSKLGGLIGFIAGGALSVLVVIVFMISQALLLGGTYLLMTSGTAQMSFTEFSTNKLIFGTLLLAIGLVTGKGFSLSWNKNR